MRKLRRSEKQLAYSVADRVRFVSSSDDRTEAFLADAQIAKLDPSTILALLKIALLLWKWWNSSMITACPIDIEVDDE